MPVQTYFAQTYPTDNAVAVLQNLCTSLMVPIAPLAVEQAIYGHPDFPFISLHHLSELLMAWGLVARPVRIAPETLARVALPAIAYIEKKPRGFVLLQNWNGKAVTYLHPATGWVEESLETFSQYWPGILLEVLVPGAIASVGPRPAPAPRAGIALTLVNAEKTLASFLRYHLESGFEHIFLFFDKPEDESLLIAKSYDKVSIIARDADLEARWKACRLYPQLKQQLHRPEARQLLNMEIAIQLALAQQLDWLLQIDADELFYSPHLSVQEHFAALTKEQVHQATYPNYEAVSQRVEIEDYFKEVTLFKKNLAQLSLAQRRTLLRYTQKGVNLSFLAYNNGKSAARVEPNLLPWGNHYFRLRQGEVAYQKKHRVLAAAPATSPVILHYAECGFGHFWQKYKTWGDFPDTFLGGQRIIDSVPFRIAAREVAQTGDERRARSFYENNAVLQDEQIIDALLQEAVLCRIIRPAVLLKTTQPMISRA